MYIILIDLILNNIIKDVELDFLLLQISMALCAFLVSTSAKPQGYTAPGRGGGGFISGGSSGGGFISGGSFGGGFSSGGSGGGFGGGGGFSGGIGGSCPEGQARKGDGSCATAQISRNIFLYAAPPAQQIRVGPAPHLPDPKVHYNYVFVRTPETRGGVRPIVVPPPQQKTLVYVLNKRPGAQNQEVIEVPSTPTQPEVFFVNYAAGDNPQLPGGIDLQQALSQSQQQGRIIDGGVAVGGGFAAGGGGVIGGGGGGFVSGGGRGSGFGGGSISSQYSSPL